MLTQKVHCNPVATLTQHKLSYMNKCHRWLIQSNTSVISVLTDPMCICSGYYPLVGLVLAALTCLCKEFKILLATAVYSLIPYLQ